MDGLSNSGIRFYRQSGKAPILGLLLVGVTGLLVVPILGIIYGYLDYYIPWIYLNIALVFGFAFAVSWILERVAIHAKIRNGVLVFIIALIVGVIADYSGWVGWISAILGSPSYLIGFFYPQDVVGVINEIASQAAYNMSGTTFTGQTLYIIWFVEAILVIGGITYMTNKDYSSLPFCEECEEWARKRTTLGIFRPIEEPEQFKDSLLERGLSAFSILEENEPDNNDFTLLDLYECEHCKNFMVLHVDDVAVSFDRKGKMTSTVVPIISNVILDAPALSRLRSYIRVQSSDIA